MDSLIEDYLFGNGKRLKSSKDQNFAKPIEDEDLFAVAEYAKETDEVAQSSQSQNNDELGEEEEDEEEEEPSSIQDCDEGSHGQLERLEASQDQLIEEAPTTGEAPSGTDLDERPTEHSSMELDDIFADDYSRSPEPIRPTTDYSRPVQATENQPSPAQLKAKQFREKLLAQAKSLNLKGKFATGFEKQGFIEVDILQSKLVSNSSSKFIFNKMFNRSKKALDHHKSPETKKESWSSMRESLRKKICSERRKVWDSFQRPADNFDDEEEIIGSAAEDTTNLTEEVDDEEAEGDDNIESESEDDAQVEQEDEDEEVDEDEDEDEDQEEAEEAEDEDDENQNQEEPEADNSNNAKSESNGSSEVRDVHSNDNEKDKQEDREAANSKNDIGEPEKGKLSPSHYTYTDCSGAVFDEEQNDYDDEVEEYYNYIDEPVAEEDEEETGGGQEQAAASGDGDGEKDKEDDDDDGNDDENDDDELIKSNKRKVVRQIEESDEE